MRDTRRSHRPSGGVPDSDTERHVSRRVPQPTRPRGTPTRCSRSCGCPVWTRGPVWVSPVRGRKQRSRVRPVTGGVDPRPINAGHPQVSVGQVWVSQIPAQRVAPHAARPADVGHPPSWGWRCGCPRLHREWVGVPRRRTEHPTTKRPHLRVRRGWVSPNGERWVSQDGDGRRWASRDGSDGRTGETRVDGQW